MAHTRGLAAVHTIFVRPKGMPENWEKTDLWRTPQINEEINLISDPGGVEARRFEATTSGQVLLYGSDGNLMFDGGITGGRGHAGDNAGRDAVFSWLRWGEARRDRTLVFGCPLFTTHLACAFKEGECCP